MSPCVLVLSPHAKDRAALVRVLSPRHTVLAAGDLDEAVGLVRACPGCRLAYCGLGRDAGGVLEAARTLKAVRPGLTVIALIRPPWPESLREAAATGLLGAVRTLPVADEDLLAQTRAALGPEPSLGARPKPSGGLLTREEIDFLLGRVALPGLAACPPAH
ncbi:MAG: hypothetical protein AAGU21_00610 [Solidesulfovibrio sp.]|uniref:hypothetical protein n=1 Tax=Solidesulfovibrio sp. TaxID=2910990 RepID=UPI002B211BCF|nr:hypothetical protein [Solidesulfovibrio sp.]MEA4857345.1 hypothetical protein [Solidesulfovibrio sp.]